MPSEFWQISHVGSLIQLQLTEAMEVVKHGNVARGHFLIFPIIQVEGLSQATEI